MVHSTTGSFICMMKSSNGNIFRVTGSLCVEFIGHRWIHKGQWRGALMFPLVCSWTNSWVNDIDASDLRRHRAHYDIIVLSIRLKSAVIAKTWANNHDSNTSCHMIGMRPSMENCIFHRAPLKPCLNDDIAKPYLSGLCFVEYSIV